MRQNLLVSILYLTQPLHPGCRPTVPSPCCASACRRPAASPGVLPAAQGGADTGHGAGGPGRAARRQLGRRRGGHRGGAGEGGGISLAAGCASERSPCETCSCEPRALKQQINTNLPAPPKSAARGRPGAALEVRGAARLPGLPAGPTLPRHRRPRGQRCGTGRAGRGGAGRRDAGEELV